MLRERLSSPLFRLPYDSKLLIGRSAYRQLLLLSSRIGSQVGMFEVAADGKFDTQCSIDREVAPAPSGRGILIRRTFHSITGRNGDTHILTPPIQPSAQCASNGTSLLLDRQALVPKVPYSRASCHGRIWVCSTHHHNTPVYLRGSRWPFAFGRPYVPRHPRPLLITELRTSNQLDAFHRSTGYQ